jgi:carbon storage regulator
MLYLSRKIGESIVINNSIELTVVEVRGKSVKLGFVFPPDATVLRKEIYDKIMAENMAAAGSESDMDFFEGDFDLSHLDAAVPPIEKK